MCDMFFFVSCSHLLFFWMKGDGKTVNWSVRNWKHIVFRTHANFLTHPFSGAVFSHALATCIIFRRKCSQKHKSKIWTKKKISIPQQRFQSKMLQLDQRKNKYCTQSQQVNHIMCRFCIVFDEHVYMCEWNVVQEHDIKRNSLTATLWCLFRRWKKKIVGS